MLRRCRRANVSRDSASRLSPSLAIREGDAIGKDLSAHRGIALTPALGPFPHRMARSVPSLSSARRCFQLKINVDIVPFKPWETGKQPQGGNRRRQRKTNRRMPKPHPPRDHCEWMAPYERRPPANWPRDPAMLRGLAAARGGQSRPEFGFKGSRAYLLGETPNVLLNAVLNAVAEP